MGREHYLRLVREPPLPLHPPPPRPRPCPSTRLPPLAPAHSDALIEKTPDIYGGLEMPMEKAIQQMLELGIDTPRKMMGVTKQSLKQAGWVAARRNRVMAWQESMRRAEAEERQARTAAGVAAAKARAEAEASMQAPPPIVGALREVLRHLVPAVDEVLATDVHSHQCTISNCRLMGAHKLCIGPTSAHHAKSQPRRLAKIAVAVETLRQHLHDLELDQIALPEHIHLTHAVNVVVELETWCWGVAASQYLRIEREQRNAARRRGGGLPGAPPPDPNARRFDREAHGYFGEAVLSSTDMAGVEPPSHERVHVDGESEAALRKLLLCRDRHSDDRNEAARNMTIAFAQLDLATVVLGYPGGEGEKGLAMLAEASEMLKQAQNTLKRWAAAIRMHNLTVWGVAWRRWGHYNRACRNWRSLGSRKFYAVMREELEGIAFWRHSGIRKRMSRGVNGMGHRWLWRSEQRRLLASATRSHAQYRQRRVLGMFREHAKDLGSTYARMADTVVRRRKRRYLMTCVWLYREIAAERRYKALLQQKVLFQWEAWTRRQILERKMATRVQTLQRRRAQFNPFHLNLARNFTEFILHMRIGGVPAAGGGKKSAEAGAAAGVPGSYRSGDRATVSSQRLADGRGIVSHREELYQYGLRYESGGPGFEKNLAKAVRYLERASDLGHYRAE